MSTHSMGGACQGWGATAEAPLGQKAQGRGADVPRQVSPTLGMGSGHTYSPVPRLQGALLSYLGPGGWGCSAAGTPPLQPGPPRPKWPLPLRGSTGRGTQQVLEETLELWVPGGLQAARVPEGDIPQRSFGCSW